MYRRFGDRKLEQGRGSDFGAEGAICSADGSTHTESNKLYRQVKHRACPNLSSRQRPKRAPIRRRSRRRQRRGEPQTEHGLGVLLAFVERPTGLTVRPAPPFPPARLRLLDHRPRAAAPVSRGGGGNVREGRVAGFRAGFIYRERVWILNRDCLRPPDHRPRAAAPVSFGG